MQRVKILLIASLLVTGFAFEAPARQTPPASAFVQDLADRAIANLTEPGLSNQEREHRFRALFREGFAIRGIAKFTLGRYWRAANDQQRDEYLALFEDVIVDNWAARFTKYSGQRFEIREESHVSGTANESVVIVQSLIWASPDTPVRVNWRVANAGELYKITDVIVEGISMANTQREEFASLVRKDSLAGLINTLRLKSGQDGKLAALVGASNSEILPASGAAHGEPAPWPFSSPPCGLWSAPNWPDPTFGQNTRIYWPAMSSPSSASTSPTAAYSSASAPAATPPMPTPPLPAKNSSI